MTNGEKNELAQVLAELHEVKLALGRLARNTYAVGGPHGIPMEVRSSMAYLDEHVRANRPAPGVNERRLSDVPPVQEQSGRYLPIFNSAYEEVVRNG